MDETSPSTVRRPKSPHRLEGSISVTKVSYRRRCTRPGARGLDAGTHDCEFHRWARSAYDWRRGVTLFNTDRQLMWARATPAIMLEPGVYAFWHTFPTLPLGSGAYQWQASLLNEGELLEVWDCVPKMNIPTQIRQHHTDKWTGILNVLGTFAVVTLDPHTIEQKIHLLQ